MNGTSNWCTLVDVHPEGQNAVRKSVRTASLAWYSRFRILPLQCPARGSLTSPGVALGVVAPRGASLFLPLRGGQWGQQDKDPSEARGHGASLPFGRTLRLLPGTRRGSPVRAAQASYGLLGCVVGE